MLKLFWLLLTWGAALSAGESLRFQDVLDAVPGMAQMRPGDDSYQFNGALFIHGGEEYQVRSCLFLTPPGSQIHTLKDLEQLTPSGQKTWPETAVLEPLNIGFGLFYTAQMTFLRRNLYVEYPAPLPISVSAQNEVLYHLSISVGLPDKTTDILEKPLPSSHSQGVLTVADVLAHVPQVANQAPSWMVLTNPAQYTFQKDGYLFQLVQSAFEARSEAALLKDEAGAALTLHAYCAQNNLLDQPLRFQSLVGNNFECIQWMEGDAYIKLMLRRLPETAESLMF